MHARRVLKRVGIGLGALVGGVVVLAGIGIGALHTNWGGERLRGFVLPKVNESIAGRLDVERLALHGVGVELGGVTLLDPDGLVVARIARLDAAVALRPLLSKNIDITKILIERPHFDLVQSARGLNLARALAPSANKTPEPKEPADPNAEPAELQLALRRLHVSEGVVTYRDTRPGGMDPVRIEALDVIAAGSVALPEQKFEGNVAINARPRRPVDGPFALRLAGKGEGFVGNADLTVTLAEGRIALRARSQSEDVQTLFIDGISIPPALVHAFAPTAPVLATVDAKGEVFRRGNGVKADINVTAATTRAKISADVDVARAHARSLLIDIKGVDLSRLIADGPPSHFNVRVQGEGGGRSLATLTGKLNVDMPAGNLGGRPVGPARVVAAADGGRFEVSTLDVALPGLSLTGRGQGTQQTLSFSAQLVARDLGLLARSARLPRSLGLAGNGKLALTLGGRPDAIAARVTGGFPALRASGTSVNGLTLDARAANVQAAPVGASLALAAKSLRSGKNEVTNLSLSFNTAPDNAMRIALSAAKPLAVKLTATGRVSPKAERIDLATLALSYPQVSWKLARPARVVRKGDDLAVSDFVLEAAPNQRITVDFQQRKSRIKAQAQLQAFDLGRLPALLLPPGTKLSGRLDLRADVSGNPARPDATAVVALADGRFNQFQDLSLTLQGRHRRGRVAGTLAAHALGTDHKADFDMPVVWPPAADAPLSLTVKLGELDVEKLAALTAKPNQPPPKVKGRLAVDLSVDGPAADPTLAMNITGRALELGGDKLDDVRVALRDPAGKPLLLEANTTVLGRKSHLRVETPVVLGRWLRRPPTNDELLDAPFTVNAAVDQLPLAAVGGRTGNRPTLGGTVSARVALTGPVMGLHGTLAVDAVDVRGPRFPPTSATVRTRLGRGREGIDTQIKVARRGATVADLTAKLGLGINDLLEKRALSSAAVKVAGRVGPITLQRMAAGGITGRPDGRALRAQVGATIALDGTLGDPRADLRLDVNEAHIGGQPLGTASAKLNYKNAKPHLDLRLASARGGSMEITGDANVDLSLPALMKGLVVAEIPVNSRLRSRALDLFFLSAVHDDIRSVDGKLDADATLTGQIGAPQMAGRVGWQKGRVVLAGFGEIRDIELALRGDQREMVLERLFARAGNGDANVTAKASRLPDGRQLKVEARAKLKRFRVQTEGQPLGSITLDARADGTVAPDRIAIATVIEEAHLDLAGGDRRRLQSLARPTDVVILANGEPVDRKQAKRYDAIMERRQATTNAPVVAPASNTSARSASGKAVASAPAPGDKTTSAAERARIAARTRPQDPRDTRITVQAPRNLWVRGPDANLELGLDPGFVVNMTGEPRIFGTVKIRRGYVVVIGKRFDLTAGSSVRFEGPPDLPELSVNATHRANKADATVQVHIEGPADALKFTLRSPEHPEWGDTELLSVLATGRPPDEPGGGGTSPGGQAASLLGGLLADRLQQTLTSRLPIDVLVIEPGDNLLGPTLEAGTYFGDDIYVAYVGRMGDDEMGRENRNEVHLEYQLTSRWSFEATYGDARRGSADLLWTRHY